MRAALLALLLLAAPALGQPSAQPPPISFPELPPPATPVPPPDPAAIATLNPTQVYVVTADVPALLLASPLGLVAIAEQAGPITIHAKFVGGSGEFETKTFSAKQVFLVTAVATGRVELLAVPAGATSEKQVLRRLIDCQVGPRPPPPDPTPVPPDPKPPDPPTPGPVKDLRVLIVYETMDVSKLPAAQQSVLYSKVVRDYLNTHCVVGPDGKTKEYRIYDQNVDLAGEAAVWRELMVRPRTVIPWITIQGGGKVVHEGALPLTVEETMILLKRWGG